MSSRKEIERAKLIQEKCQTLLTQMLRDEDNKYCVDCDAKGPRWASWNLGVFLCIRCAGIHRNLGVHISRVKSVNLDSWTPEQVVSLQQMGNSRARAVYEAQLPDGFRRPQTDSALESFIRAKYEHKKYLAREWVQPSPPKVDWAKEIDEEIEKQKRKKKSQSTTLGSLGGSGINDISSRKQISAKAAPIPAPLPKPKSLNSPKVNKLSDNSNQLQQQNNSSDLLGLSSPVNSCEPKNKSNENGDGFSGFLSAPVTSSTLEHSGNNVNGPLKGTNEKNSGINSLAKEEEDFFKQSSSQLDKEKGKLTKDSILALYGTAPSNSIGQFNNNPLVGYNSTYSHQAGAGQFMSMPPVPSQPQQFGAGLHQHHPHHQTVPVVPVSAISGISSIVPSPSSLVGHTAQFGVHNATASAAAAGSLVNNLNLNLAGMPPGFLGPPQHPQHHHQPQQFMSTPSSVTSMYNAPVMTAPGAFTSAIQQQQIMPQPTFAQFPQAFGSMMPTIPSSTISASSGSGFSAAGMMPTIGLGGGPMAVQFPTTAQAAVAPSLQPTSSNLSQQFSNLNLGNVWQ